MALLHQLAITGFEALQSVLVEGLALEQFKMLAADRADFVFALPADTAQHSS